MDTYFSKIESAAKTTALVMGTVTGKQAGCNFKSEPAMGVAINKADGLKGKTFSIFEPTVWGIRTTPDDR